MTAERESTGSSEPAELHDYVGEDHCPGWDSPPAVYVAHSSRLDLTPVQLEELLLAAAASIGFTDREDISRFDNFDALLAAVRDVHHPPMSTILVAQSSLSINEAIELLHAIEDPGPHEERVGWHIPRLVVVGWQGDVRIDSRTREGAAVLDHLAWAPNYFSDPASVGKPSAPTDNNPPPADGSGLPRWGGSRTRIPPPLAKEVLSLLQSGGSVRGTVNALAKQGISISRRQVGAIRVRWLAAQEVARATE